MVYILINFFKYAYAPMCHSYLVMLYFKVAKIVVFILVLIGNSMFRATSCNNMVKSWLFLFVERGSLKCTDSYVYQYSSINLVCNPQDQLWNVVFECATETLNRNVSISWLYKDFLPSNSRTRFVKTVSVNGYYNVLSILTVLNFSARNNGCYYCQLHDNATVLSELFGCISFDIMASINCSSLRSFLCSKQKGREFNIAAGRLNINFTPPYSSFNWSLHKINGIDAAGDVWYVAIGLLVFLMSLFSASLTLAITVCCSGKRTKMGKNGFQHFIEKNFRDQKHGVSAIVSTEVCQ